VSLHTSFTTPNSQASKGKGRLWSGRSRRKAKRLKCAITRGLSKAKLYIRKDVRQRVRCKIRQTDGSIFQFEDLTSIAQTFAQDGSLIHSKSHRSRCFPKMPYLTKARSVQQGFIACCLSPNLYHQRVAYVDLRCDLRCLNDSLPNCRLILVRHSNTMQQVNCRTPTHCCVTSQAVASDTNRICSTLSHTHQDSITLQLNLSPCHT
jgi:hypothetical protein